MQSRLAILLMTLLLALSPALYAAGKKSDKARVTFHLETEGTDNPKMIFPQMTNGQTRYFRRIPELSLKDIATFAPFASQTGDAGIVFKLKQRGANRLAAISNANQGRWLLAQLNGRTVDAVLIDQPINDGTLVVWKGVTPADIASLDKSLPRAGQEKKD